MPRAEAAIEWLTKPNSVLMTVSDFLTPFYTLLNLMMNHRTKPLMQHINKPD
ncbi:hypothetical protein MESS2_810021 [Mesorhizobium metallidurans STM 2683]|uniref:Uncharacterized protein n=1 Tax=Mesorhizobium metallidurans STM 2683 TaxID=1297569 RepID=M5EXW9_9HYPH|nr:hypothetical protein MESS2_810021 [Mesorhizobium metallidurans STM 2683]